MRKSIPTSIPSKKVNAICCIPTEVGSGIPGKSISWASTPSSDAALAVIPVMTALAILITGALARRLCLLRSRESAKFASKPGTGKADSVEECTDSTSESYGAAGGGAFLGGAT